LQQDRAKRLALELPSALRERAAELAGAEALVLDAFELGCEAGAERLAGELLGYIFERQLEAGRLYEALSPARAAAIERSYQDRAYPPAVEAHFGATSVVLNDLHAELRRVHPPKTTSRTRG